MKLAALNRENENMWRGVAALFVAVGHMLPMDFYIFIPGQVFVSLFFFYTGYGCMKAGQTRGSHFFEGFIKRRIVKLYIPFMIAEAIYMMLSSCQTRNIPNACDAVLKVIGFRLSNSTLWYIQVAIVFYLVFYIKYRKSIPYKPDYIFWSAFCLVYYIVVIGAGLGRFYYMAIISLPIGVITAQLEKTRPFLEEKVAMFLRIGSLLFIVLRLTDIFLYFWKKSNDIVWINGLWMVIKMASAALFVCLILFLGNKVRRIPRVMTALGKYSLEIYLYHNLAILLVGTNSVGKLIVCLLVTLALAIISHNAYSMTLDYIKMHIKAG